MIESVSPSDNDVMHSYSLEIFFFYSHLPPMLEGQAWASQTTCVVCSLVWSFMRISIKRCLETNHMLRIMQYVLASSALILSDFFENYYVYPFSIPDALCRIQNNFQDMQ